MHVTLFQFQYGKTLPASAVYLATSLEKEKINFDLKLFSVFNFYKSSRPLDMLFSFLAGSKEIVAIGCFSDMLPYVLMALQKIKSRWPQKIIILGGIGPTTVAEEILDAFDFVDFIIKGPGVIALPRLIKKISKQEKDLSDLSMVYTRNKKTGININIYDFASDIPTVTAYDFIRDIRLFDKFLIKTSSGCPYQCTFCYARPVVDRKINYRDIDEVVDEIKAIQKQRKGKFTLRIIDEAFIVNRNRVIEFCGRLREHKLNVQWVCYGRVNCVDRKLLKIMFNAGCREVYYGIESGSNRILQRIKKRFSIQEAIEVALVTKEVIPNVTASFIYRYPFEYLQDFIDTFVSIRYLQLKNINTQLHPLVPVKNSEIYLEYKKSLRFSLQEPCDYMSNSAIGDMPYQFKNFILNYPEVFYDYGYYENRDLVKINQMIKKNMRKMFPRATSLW